MRVIWTKHAEERQMEWEKKLGITKVEVENVLRIVRNKLSEVI